LSRDSADLFVPGNYSDFPELENSANSSITLRTTEEDGLKHPWSSSQKRSNVRFPCRNIWKYFLPENDFFSKM